MLVIGTAFVNINVWLWLNYYQKSQLFISKQKCPTFKNRKSPHSGKLVFQSQLAGLLKHDYYFDFI